MSELKKTEDEILSCAQSGSNIHYERIIKKYRSAVEAIASKYKDSALDSEDLVQEGMIGLLAAIKSYRSDKGASFATYSKICIDNSIQSALRKFNRQKDIPANSIIEYREDDLPAENGHASTEDIVIARESVSQLSEVLKNSLSDFENEVLRLHIVGCSYNEIAGRLRKTPKAIDNALQRARKKLAYVSFSAATDNK